MLRPILSRPVLSRPVLSCPVLAFLCLTTAAGAVAAEPLTARGVVRSQARLDLRTDLDAVIRSAPFVDGERFARGDVLVSFDCRRHRAERDAAKARAVAARIEALSKAKLHRHGAVGRSELERAGALHRSAAARSEALDARLASCAMAAPFDGRIVRLAARAGERPRAGEPVVTIVDDRRLRLEIVAPSNWLAWARTGRTFRFRVDETGRVHAARLTGTGAEVDPRTRTIVLHAALDGTGVLPGMSGDAIFEAE